VVAVGRPQAGLDARAAIAPRAGAELTALWALYAAGAVREMYSPGGPRAVLLMESESIAAAAAALAGLPLVATRSSSLS
jgi:hypothetical protein